jgi:uncharacterized protein YlxW (UPF0749 family)
MAEIEHFLVLSTISGNKNTFPITIAVIGPPKNMPPTFKETLPATLKFSVVYKDGKLLEGETVQLKSPQAVDPEGDEIKMMFTGHVALSFVSLI